MPNPTCTRCKNKVSIVTYKSTTKGYEPDGKIGDPASSCLNCISPNSRARTVPSTLYSH